MKITIKNDGQTVFLTVRTYVNDTFERISRIEREISLALLDAMKM